MKEENTIKKGVKVIPLGGLEQIGMNITAFEYEDSIIVVDCGLSFPEDDMLGIDLVIPDVTYLKENISKVKGFVITHGHEDHIGSLPYILRDINVPIYATKLTIGIIENKLKENNLTELIPTHGNILTALYESDKKLTMKEIAKKIGKDKSTVTPLVNKLITLGYIQKEKSITDKRVTYISLTSKARDIEDTFNIISSQVRETANKDFTPEEKEEFLRLLRKLNSNFKMENEK